jgi:hypothetical protein
MVSGNIVWSLRAVILRWALRRAAGNFESDFFEIQSVKSFRTKFDHFQEKKIERKKRKS